MLLNYVNSANVAFMIPFLKTLAKDELYTQ